MAAVLSGGGEDLTGGSTRAEQGSIRGEAGDSGGGHPARQRCPGRQPLDNTQPNARRALSTCKDDPI